MNEDLFLEDKFLGVLEEIYKENCIIDSKERDDLGKQYLSLLKMGVTKDNEYYEYYESDFPISCRKVEIPKDKSFSIATCLNSNGMENFCDDLEYEIISQNERTLCVINDFGDEVEVFRSRFGDIRKETQVVSFTIEVFRYEDGTKFNFDNRDFYKDESGKIWENKDNYWANQEPSHNHDYIAMPNR